MIKALKRHKVVIFKCDTIYGLMGLPPFTYRRICEIKGRDASLALLILIASPVEVPNFSLLPLPEKLRIYWPGALTLIFPGHEAGSSVALRCPDDPFLHDILSRGGLSLYSTSVNQHGQPPLGAISQIVDQFGAQVDLIVDSGDLAGGVPSTILDIRSAPFKVVRQGSLVLPAELLA